MTVTIDVELQDVRNTHLMMENNAIYNNIIIAINVSMVV